MTCAAAETWLLVARSASELPDSVRTHVAQCRGCAVRLAALVRTDDAVRSLAPPPDASARRRLADALRCAPQPTSQPTASQTQPARDSFPVPRWAVALAAAVLVALGWAVGRWSSTPPAAPVPPSETATPGQPEPPAPRGPEPPPGLSVAPYPSQPAGHLARTARYAARVAEDPAALAQAEALDRFAAEVRAEVVRQASTGHVDGLPRLTSLHDRLLKFGLVRQLSRLPEGQRAVASTPIAEGLRQAAGELAALLAQFPTPIGDLLQPLPAACRETADEISQGKAPVAAGDWPAPPTPLEAVAAQTIRLANTDNPLARADESAQLAVVLGQLVTVLSVSGQTDDAARIGDSIAAVLDHGVAGNLDRVETGDPGGKLKADVARVRERAGNATDVLERNLNQVPPAARHGLERAIAATEPGRAKATGKSGKAHPGPPWKSGEHPGKGGKPPGWQKKP